MHTTQAQEIKFNDVIIQNEKVQAEKIKCNDVIIQNEKVQDEDIKFKDVIIQNERAQAENIELKVVTQGLKSIGNTGTVFPGGQTFGRKGGAFTEKNQEDRWNF